MWGFRFRNYNNEPKLYSLRTWKHNFASFMRVKLGLSSKGKDIDWGVWEQGAEEIKLDKERKGKEQEDEEKGEMDRVCSTNGEVKISSEWRSLARSVGARVIIILKWILQEYSATLHSRVIYSPSERESASQNRFRSMELVSYIINYLLFILSTPLFVSCLLTYETILKTVLLRTNSLS